MFYFTNAYSRTPLTNSFNFPLRALLFSFTFHFCFKNLKSSKVILAPQGTINSFKMLSQQIRLAVSSLSKHPLASTLFLGSANRKKTDPNITFWRIVRYVCVSFTSDKMKANYLLKMPDVFTSLHIPSSG